MEFSIEGSDSWETNPFQDKFMKKCFNTSISASSVNSAESKSKKAKKRKRHNKDAAKDRKHIKKRKMEIVDHDSSLPGGTDEITKLDGYDGSGNLVKSSGKDSFSQKRQKTKSKKECQMKNESKTNLNNLSTRKGNKKQPKDFPTRNVSEKFASSSSFSKKIAGRLSNQNATVSPQGKNEMTAANLARNWKTQGMVNTGKHSDKLNFMKDKYSYQKKIVKTGADRTIPTETKSKKSTKSHSETAFPRSHGRNNKWTMKKDVSNNSSSSSFDKTATEKNADGKNLSYNELQKTGKRCSESGDVAFPRNNENNKRWGVKKDFKSRNPETDSNRRPTPTDINAKQLQNSKDKSLTLKEKALLNLQAAKFRILNEKLYTITSDEAYQFFKSNSDAFTDYHLGYEQQVRKWPVNPVDLIIKSLKQLPKNIVIADLGCGDAKIAKTLHKCKVLSYDLVAVNEHVTCCDMAKVPLPSGSVDVVVFCLSLMGKNLDDYLQQAFRILKLEGLLKIAEVESRIDDLDKFISATEAYGFGLVKKDISHKMFVLLDFRKMKKKNKKSNPPKIQLQPCLYKKR